MTTRDIQHFPPPAGTPSADYSGTQRAQAAWQYIKDICDKATGEVHMTGLDGCRIWETRELTQAEEQAEQIAQQAAMIHDLQDQLDAARKGAAPATDNSAAMRAQLEQADADRAKAVADLQATVDGLQRRLSDWESGKLVRDADGSLRPS